MYFFYTRRKLKYLSKGTLRIFLYDSKEPFITNSYPTLRFYNLNLKMKTFQICNELECGSLLLGSFVGSCKVSHINRSQLRLRTKYFPRGIFWVYSMVPLFSTRNISGVDVCEIFVDFTNIADIGRNLKILPNAVLVYF